MLIANTIQLDHPDGIIRMSSLPYVWTDPEGRTWQPGASILSFEERERGDAADPGGLTITLTGDSQTNVADLFDPSVVGSKLLVETVYLDDDGITRVAGPLDSFVGIVDTPEFVRDPSKPTISISAESPLMLLGRTRRVIFDEATQSSLDPADISARWIAKLRDIPEAGR